MYSYKKIKKVEKIPNALRFSVFKTYINDTLINGKCYCCRITNISIDNFDCGHVKSRNDGGEISLKNLRPICGQCNSSMGTMNMITFIKKYKLWESQDIMDFEEQNKDIDQQNFDVENQNNDEIKQINNTNNINYCLTS